jgi:hypothetical protein
VLLTLLATPSDLVLIDISAGDGFHVLAVGEVPLEVLDHLPVAADGLGLVG